MLAAEVPITEEAGRLSTLFSLQASATAAAAAF